jgi:hypothetical protein
MPEKKNDPMTASEAILHLDINDLARIFVTQKEFGEYTTKLAEKLGMIDGTLKGMRWLTIVVLGAIAINIILGLVGR